MSPSNADESALDAALDALRHPYRRGLLFALVEDDAGSIDLADWAPRGPEGEVAVDDEFFRLTMYHRHLPKLADLGYVEWDRERGAVSPGAGLDAVEPLIQLLAEYRPDPPTSRT